MHRYRTLLATLGGLFEPEYQAVLNRADALGYTLPSSTQNISNNNKVKYLKAEGLWSGLSVLWYNKQEAGLEDFATLNWVNPSLFQLNQSNSSLKPTFVPNNGFRGGNGTGQRYFNAGWIPQNDTNVAINNIAVFYRFFDIPSPFTVPTLAVGTRTGINGGQLLFLNNSNNSVLNRIGNTTQQNIIPQGGQNSHFSAIRTNNDSYPSYLNSVLNLTYLPASPIALSPHELVYLGFNNNGTKQGSNSNGGLSYAGIGSGNVFEGKQVELYEIMEDLYTP
jgi:hypothetical protein